MHIGLFFGSFNPVHIGHMVLANYMVEFTDIDKVWFVVSPHNPLKNKESLLDQNQRLHMVNLAIGDSDLFKSSNIEFGLSQPSYTIHTLAHLKEKYPQHTFSLILGHDNLSSFHKWKNFDEILNQHKLFVYPRPNTPRCDLEKHPSVYLTDSPMVEISSTFIRNSISKKKNMAFFVPQAVWIYIDEMSFYKKKTASEHKN
jgi:nicotinate-nucleotide adenylyltransferase